MSLRNSLFWMHLSVGVFAAIFILIIAVTGGILAFENQIEEAFEHNLRFVNVGERRLSLDEVAARTAAVNPEGRITAVTVKADPAASVFVNFGSDGLYIDPYTGHVLGSPSKIEDFMEGVQAWHRWLGMPKPVGRQVKGVVTLAFLAMIISGIYLWRPKVFKWPAIKNIVFFNQQARGKARDWNWHNVTGIWCAPILLIIVLTGLFMVYPWASSLTYKLAGIRPPSASEKMGGGTFAVPTNLENFLTAAVQQEPNWHTMVLRPGKPGLPVTIMIKEKSSPYPSPRSILKLDPVTAAVMSWEPLSAQEPGRRLTVLMRYLHTGQAGGVIGQALAFLAALGATMLVWTGLSMAWRRFFLK